MSSRARALPILRISSHCFVFGDAIWVNSKPILDLNRRNHLENSMDIANLDMRAVPLQFGLSMRATDAVEMSPSMEFEAWSRSVVENIEKTLSERLSIESCDGNRLAEAIRYAALGGGKRLRPMLCHAAGYACGASEPVLNIVGSAIEMLHVCTLVHDDLPAMDNDVLRRGKATVHVKYDEGIGILVGDALQSLAFLALSNAPLPAAQRTSLIHELAIAIGPRGAAAGQSIDIANAGCNMTLNELESMHRLKTGALMIAAVRMGALCALSGPEEYPLIFDALTRYGEAIGLAFQVVDDILDKTGDTASLGKTAGKDEKANKPTYVSVLGLDASRALVQTLRQTALRAVEPLGRGARYLELLAEKIVDRAC